MILSSIQVVDLWRLAKGEFLWTFRIMDRWSCHRSKSVTCGESSRGRFPWLLELRISDSVIDPSRWLVATRRGEFPLTFGIMDRGSCYHGGVFLDFWNYESLILSLIQVGLVATRQGEFHFSFLRIMDRWSYHRSKSFTWGDWLRGRHPDFGIMDR